MNGGIEAGHREKLWDYVGQTGRTPNRKGYNCGLSVLEEEAHGLSSHGE